MRTLYVVTHPEATHHVEGLVGGWYDSVLTERGRVQAQAIAHELRRCLPDGGEVEIYSSDLRRTAQTADEIAASLGAEPVLLSGLREKSYGEAEGREQSWLDERMIPPPPHGDRMHHFEGVPGSETKAQFGSRVYEAVDRILESDCEHQIIVTHGFALTFVVARWIQMPLAAAGFVNVRASGGGITELEQDDHFHNRRIVSLNRVDHLDGI